MTHKLLNKIVGYLNKESNKPKILSSSWMMIIIIQYWCLSSIYRNFTKQWNLISLLNLVCDLWILVLIVAYFLFILALLIWTFSKISDNLSGEMCFGSSSLLLIYNYISVMISIYTSDFIMYYNISKQFHKLGALIT